tara:strand:+ start:412 stop:723 length:312 start_codon:yes stop_codon:yes gene_type:complete
MISDVKQATLVADGRFQNNHAGAGTYIGRSRLKGVTGRCDSTATAQIKLYDGTDATGTLKYHLYWGAAAGDMYQEYISDDGILFENGIFADLINCNAASIIWG